MAKDLRLKSLGIFPASGYLSAAIRINYLVRIVFYGR